MFEAIHTILKLVDGTFYYTKNSYHQKYKTLLHPLSLVFVEKENCQTELFSYNLVDTPWFSLVEYIEYHTWLDWIPRVWNMDLGLPSEYNIIKFRTEIWCFEFTNLEKKQIKDTICHWATVLLLAMIFSIVLWRHESCWLDKKLLKLIFSLPHMLIRRNIILQWSCVEQIWKKPVMLGVRIPKNENLLI